MDRVGLVGSTVLDDATVRAWAGLAEECLVRVAPRIDALNVFPVADADTGTNVALTLAAGRAALVQRPSATTRSALDTLARGALLGARGSSGVILGAWLRGLADAGAGPGTDALAAGLRAAAERASGAVAHPSPGTVLSTARQIAEVAGAFAPSAPPVEVLVAAVDQARERLAGTSAEHPVLAAAGVVDAGACALLVLLEALIAVLDGASGDRVGDWLPAGDGPGDVADGGPAFEVMAVLEADHEPEGLRAGLVELGDAVALTGDGSSWRTHVHTDVPAQVLRLAAGGRLRYAVLRAVHGPHRPAALVLCPEPVLAAWFAEAGAVVIVPGPEPAEDLVEACARAGGPGVVVLATHESAARACGALTADPVAAAVACAAAAAAPDDAAGAVAAALDRLRVVEVPSEVDLTAALDELRVGGPADVLTAAPAIGSDVGRLVDLARARGLELVLLARSGDRPAWRLGLD